MATSAPTRSRGTKSRDRILRAAAEEIARTGELEVAEVARKAGVSVGLPYRYFGTRSGLLIAIVEDFHDRLGDAVVLHRFEGSTWPEREQARIRAWVSFLYADPTAPAILAGLTGDGEVATANAQRLAEAIAIGARNMAGGQREGALPRDRDPELLAAAVLGGVHSTVAVALGRDPRPPAESVIDELWRFVAGAVELTG